MIETTDNTIKEFNWKRFLSIATIVGVVLTLFFYAIEQRQKKGDARFYLQNAGQDMGVQMQSPFASRVLVPHIVRLIPLSPDKAFCLLSIFCMAVFAGLLDLHLRRLNATPLQAIQGVACCLSMFYPSLYYCQNPWSIDPPFFLFLLGGLMLILNRNDFAFSVVLAVGVYAKDALFFLVPVFCVLRSDIPFLRRIWQSAVLATPALIGYAILRFSVSSGADDTAIWHIKNELTQYTWKYIHPLASGVLLSGGIIWLWTLSKWKHLNSLQKSLLKAGIIASFPIALFSMHDAGRGFGLFASFWVPVFSTLAPTATRKAVCMILCIVCGSGIIVAATVMKILPVGEIVLRIIGGGLMASALFFTKPDRDRKNTFNFN